MNKKLNICEFKLLLRAKNKFKNYFRFKDLVPETLPEANTHTKVRVSEHQGVSPRSGKSVKATLWTSVRDHMIICDHQVAWKNFRILVNKSNKFL